MVEKFGNYWNNFSKDMVEFLGVDDFGSLDSVECKTVHFLGHLDLFCDWQTGQNNFNNFPEIVYTHSIHIF